MKTWTVNEGWWVPQPLRQIWVKLSWTHFSEGVWKGQLSCLGLWVRCHRWLLQESPKVIVKSQFFLRDPCDGEDSCCSRDNACKEGAVHLILKMRNCVVRTRDERFVSRYIAKAIYCIIWKHQKISRYQRLSRYFYDIFLCMILAIFGLSWTS